MMCASAKKHPSCLATKLWRTDPVFGFLRTDTQALDAFFPKNMHVTEKLAGVLAIYAEKRSDVSQAAMGGRETHTKSCTTG